ncbi:MAG: 23S rRNA pseudouridine(2604) synthase RluF [Chitinophagales bacterium]|nr:23S rRNA pseudouridine(2604) synthase RluF [Chitinophagales bacterium]MCZ2393690.1 23S rRNA pseudouridine(2604) synthase RluF [Chitinophagales bacterium]
MKNQKKSSSLHPSSRSNSKPARSRTENTPSQPTKKPKNTLSDKKKKEPISKDGNSKINYGAYTEQAKYYVKKKPKKQVIIHQDDSVSLNKYISSSGYCSRREADRLIAEGRVDINQKPAEKGNRVYPDDLVRVDGETLYSSKAPVYIAMNKPLGITSTTDLNDPDNIINYLGYPERIFPIGRLDKDSEGLILLTNHGDIVNKILRAGNQHEKEYIVQVDKMIHSDFIEGMKAGVPMLGTKTLPCKVWQEKKNIFRIILVQGLNRQIRRMCEHFGYKVTHLKRVRIMNISLGNTKSGSYRVLDKNEVEELLKDL